MRGNKKKRTRGVTLVELVFVLMAAAIVVAIGIPALLRMTDDARLVSGTNSLLASILLARSEAISRHERVVLCKSATGDVCSADAGWEQGWIVFHDANNNAEVDPGESILLREQSLGSRIKLTGNTPVAKYLSYTPDGSTKYASGGFQAGTFTVCLRSHAGSQARTVVIYKSGRPRIAKTTVDSCV